MKKMIKIIEHNVDDRKAFESFFDLFINLSKPKYKVIDLNFNQKCEFKQKLIINEKVQFTIYQIVIDNQLYWTIADAEKIVLNENNEERVKIKAGIVLP